MQGWSTFFLAAAGITLGWLLNQFSSWWSQRGQRQRTYRRMLFFLLQVEWLHERMDVSEWVDHYIDRMRELRIGGESMPEEVEIILREQITPQLAAVVMKRSKDELEKLEEGYTKAIDDLSQIAPFLAFRLEGRTSIVKRLDASQDLMGQVLNPEIGISAEQLSVLQAAMTDMQPDLLEEDLKQIRELMGAVALRIGPLTWLKTIRGYRPHGELTKEEKDELNDFIDEYIERIRERVPGL